MTEESGAAVAAETPRERDTETNEELLELQISSLELGTNIRTPAPAALKDLAASIADVGVLEPVTVVRRGEGFRLVFGHRRVAAAKLAKLATVPARVIDATDKEIPELQLVENLQREDVPVLEEARGFQQYVDSGHTQADLCRLIGRSGAYVSSRLSLLALPKSVGKLLDSGKLSVSHAEVLLRVPKAADSDGKYVAQAAASAVKRGTPVQELNRQVSQDVDSWKKAQALKKKVEGSMAPVCPTCKTPPTEERYNGLVGHGDWKDAHLWNPKTGKTVADVNAEDAARYAQRTPSRYSSPEPAKRPAPVDCREPATVRSAHPPSALVQAILKGVGADGIPLIEYDGSRGANPVLRIQLSKPLLGSVHVFGRPVLYSSGERTQFVVMASKGTDRRAGRSSLVAWERKALPAPRLRPGKAPKFDAEQLKGTAATVCGRLNKIRSSHELLEIARDAEAKGKHRAAVLDYIDTALGGRAHDGWALDWERKL